MNSFRLRAVASVLLTLTTALVARTMSAQLIPLFPPDPRESGEETTPQLSKSAQMIVDDLDSERFDELDQIADRFRRSKARVAGGAWRLHTFYSMLDVKQSSDAAMEAHLAHFEHWMAQKPESITAPVAMAQSLQSWAWMARGGGVARTVTSDGWKLFGDRIQRSRDVLEAAAKLQAKCPQWYADMMTVGLAQGWERSQMQDLFDRATQFEPAYLALYRQYANYLLPKWEGHPGDATQFAKTAADRVGGDAGDLIYFEIATVVIKRGNGGIPKGEMDWERIQRGAHVMDKQFGQSRATTNQFAFIAYQYRDQAVAAPLFASIGERWTPAVWKERVNYDRARKWASRPDAGPMAVPQPSSTPPE